MSDHEDTSADAAGTSRITVLPEIYAWLQQHPYAVFAKHMPEIDTPEAGLLRAVFAAEAEPDTGDRVVTVTGPQLDALYAYCVQAAAGSHLGFRRTIGAQMRIVEDDDLRKAGIPALQGDAIPYTHWAYFATKEAAEACSHELRHMLQWWSTATAKDGVVQGVQMHIDTAVDDDTRWLLRAAAPVTITGMTARHTAAEAIVRRHGGIYDGGHSGWLDLSPEGEPNRAQDAPVDLTLPALAAWRYDDPAQQDQVFVEKHDLDTVVIIVYRTFTAVIYTHLPSGRGSIELHDHGTVEAVKNFLALTLDMGYRPHTTRY